MKRVVLCFVATLCVLALSAQEKVKEVVSSEYNRSSLSHVFVKRSGQHSDVTNFYNQLEVSEKFDANTLRSRYLRFKPTSGVAATPTEVYEAVNRQNLGKEIISFVFNRKSDGTFDDSIILQRGQNNAKDQDIKNLAAAKVKSSAFAWGEPLVNSAYIIVFDVYKATETTDSNGNIEHRVAAMAHAFKLNGSRDVLNEFYATGWADVSSTEEERQKAIEAYKKMRFEMTHVASVSASGTSTTSKYSRGSIYAACTSAYNNALFALEQRVPAWQVATTIIARRPLAAKIGKKEGIKNGQRFQVYSYKEDRSGKLFSVKRGMVRATVVSDNRGMATGNTKPSYFYQISGMSKIHEGYTLKEKKDIRLGVALTGGMIGFGSANKGYRAGLDLDYLAHISKHGCITYAMINIGVDFINPNLLVDAMIGLGYGVPVSRFFEITPYATVGGYYDTATKKIAGYAVEPGARLAVTFQPFSIFATCGYHVFLGDKMGFGNGIAAKVGIKWTF